MRMFLVDLSHIFSYNHKVINQYLMIHVLLFLDSSMVEHSAVNRVVVGSSPTRGAYGAIAKW